MIRDPELLEPLLNAIRRFVRERLIPAEVQVDEQDAIPSSINDGTPEQQRRWLPKMATGEVIGSFALTKPDVGSDAGSARTTARRDGEAYVLNGTKRYITNAPVADLLTVMAHWRAWRWRGRRLPRATVEPWHHPYGRPRPREVRVQHRAPVRHGNPRFQRPDLGGVDEFEPMSGCGDRLLPQGSWSKRSPCRD